MNLNHSTIKNHESDNSIFEHLFDRLLKLERWRELAIRPSEDSCDEDDKPLLKKEFDDIAELERQCCKVRKLMNESLPVMVCCSFSEDDLVASQSQIPNAGLGLFYRPNSSGREIPLGTTLCYYYGHIHNFHSSKSLEDKSYLLLVAGNSFVDPGPCPNIKARYINDPLNDDLINCKFVPEPEFFRCCVVSTSPISPNTELFVSYGDLYWSQQANKGTVFRG